MFGKKLIFILILVILSTSVVYANENDTSYVSEDSFANDVIIDDYEDSSIIDLNDSDTFVNDNDTYGSFDENDVELRSCSSTIKLKFFFDF